MAKHVIIERYTFTPSTRTITVVGKNIRKEQLMLITNTTSGTVIYNFSDPSLQSTSYTNSSNTTTGLETTTIILNYNTAAMQSTDKISILVEENYDEIIPSEVMRDPVDKLRVSTPQSLIDTDFEYGVQSTKWESINLMNNRPSAFYDPTQGISNTSANGSFFNASGSYQITNVTSSGRTVTVAINNTAGIVANTPIFIQGTNDVANVDGWWIVEGVNPNVNFTFTVINTPVTATLFDTSKTYLFIGSFFTGAAIPAGTSGAITLNGTVATVTTTNPHGLRVGSGVYFTNCTGNTGLLNSSFVVANTPNTHIFTVPCAATGTITTSANNSIFPRALGYVEHRPYDGGVQFTNMSPFHGYQVIRQTRRQFRYQSGKGIQFSTGSIIKPCLYVDNIASSGTTVTVTTRFPHGLAANSQILVSGANQSGYNGLFTVTGANTALALTYTANTVPSAVTATGFPLTVSPYSWYGSSNRVGMFDSQNGFFYEYDGQQFYCVRRSSTTQLSGVTAVEANGNIVTGTNTKYSQELKPGDYIVIRGMSYLVQSILSNTSMCIYPEYRGPAATNCIVSKTIDLRFPQSEWNIDRCDGTGASSFNLDLTKMQMFYIDFTWYGAGAIRFGFKNNRGEVFYCHRIPNNNVNTEAYMRSGNVPARYETNTLASRTYLANTLTSGETTMTVNDTTLFPPVGVLVVSAPSSAGGAIEYIYYTGKTQTTFTGLQRNSANTGGIALGTRTATTFTFSNTAPTLVESFFPAQASTISHWGSSVIMDGRFDDDKSFVFVAGMRNSIANIGAGVTQPLISIRPSPCVDSGLSGILGQREIINRMQMVLRQVDIYTTSSGFGGGANMSFLITLRLNGRVSGGTFTNAGGSSLSQVAFHSSGQTVAGGEDIFGFFTNTPGVSSEELTLVRDLGNSILGGGNSFNVPTSFANVFPDGPDMITICATNVTVNTTNSINARISWTEAQA
jgi:hypothetical protein